MEKKSFIASNLERAYGLFVKELEGQLSEALDLLFDSEDTLPDAARCKALAEGFHKAKGGAGFFSLPDITRVAKELEQHLKGEHSTLLENIDEVRALVRAFERAVNAGRHSAADAGKEE